MHILFILFLFLNGVILCSAEIIECISWGSDARNGFVAITAKEVSIYEMPNSAQYNFPINGYNTPVGIRMNRALFGSIPTLKGIVMLDVPRKQIKHVGKEFGAIVSGISVCDGYIIGTSSGSLVKLSKSGHQEWKLPISVPEFSQFMEFNGAIILCDIFGNLMKIDVKSGEILNRKEKIRANIVGSPILAQNKNEIIIATFPPASLCKLSGDLEVIWRVNLKNKPNWDGPIISGNDIFLETNKGGDFFSGDGKLLRHVGYVPLPISKCIACADGIAAYDKFSKSIIIMNKSNSIIRRYTAPNTPRAFGVAGDNSVYMMDFSGEVSTIEAVNSVQLPSDGRK